MKQKLVALLSGLCFLPGMLCGGSAADPVALCRVYGADRPVAAPVVEIPLDIRALAEANGVPALRSEQWDIGVRDEHGTRLVSDFEREKTHGERGRLVWRLPGMLAAGGVRVFSLFLVKPTGGAQRGTAPAGMQVQETDQAVVISNHFCRVRHPRFGNGGLPSEIDFPGITTVRDTVLRFNDRVYDRPTRTGYCLRYDRAPHVAVVARNALRTIVEVQARYVALDGRAAPGGIHARYRFVYSADSPSVAVEAAVSQPRSQPWSELHFLEIHHATPLFPNWVLGPDHAGTFRPAPVAGKPGAGKGITGEQWGAVFGNGCAIGLAVPGTLRVYDGAGGYGTYLHGPWLRNWAGMEWRCRAVLYLGPDKGFPKRFTAWARTEGRQPRVRLEIPALKADIARAKASTDTSLRKQELYRLLHALEQGRGLQATVRGIRGLAHALPDRKGPAGPLAGIRRADDRVRVWNAHQVIALGPLSGNLGCTGLFGTRDAVDFVPRNRPGAPLWRITVHDSTGATVTLGTASSPARILPLPDLNPAEGGCRLVWTDVPLPENAGTLDVRVDVRLDADRPFARWRIEAVPHSIRWGLWEVEFPIVAGIDGRGRPTSVESVVYPRGWGERVVGPRRGVRFRGTYPSGGCVMQFAAYCAGETGLYFAAEDGRAYIKRVNIDGALQGTRFSWTQYPEDMGRVGKTYTQPYDTVTGLFLGDWYNAARLYREWALRQKWCSRGPVATRKDIPGRVKKIAVWVRTRPKPEDASTDNARASAFFQVPVANHWYNWHTIPFDNDYPNYFPPKPGFRNAVAAAHAFHPPVLQMPYINGRLWDTDTENFKEFGHLYCTKDEHLKPYIEVYGSKQKLAPMCPYTQYWRQKLQGIVWKLIDDYGLDGVYMDQIGAARPRLCMDPTHGHPLGGGHWWVEGYWQLLSHLRTKLKSAHPNAFLTTESNAEPYIEYFDAYLMCNSTRDNLVPLFSAVYHDYNLTFGRYVFPSELDQGNTYYFKLAQLFAFGAQVGWLYTDILKDKYRDGAEYLRRLARVRENALPYLALGEMLRPPVLPDSVPVIESRWRVFRTVRPVRLRAVQASAWRAPDGSVGIALANAVDRPFTFRLELDPRMYGLSRTGDITASVIMADGARAAGRLTRATDGKLSVQVAMSARGVQVIQLREASHKEKTGSRRQ